MAKDKTYRKLTALQHVLHRPEMYVGSMETQKTSLWVAVNMKSKRLVFQEVNFNHGLLKIFDEILLNAADNIQASDGRQTYIDVKLTPTEISVANDGAGIPIKKDPKHGDVYIPDLVFGHLLTSSNYDLDSSTMVAGRHGYGAKLTNIFSKKFIAQCACDGMWYKKTWTQNMTPGEEEVRSKYMGQNVTKITFAPDFERFGCESFSPDMQRIIFARCIDLAVSCTGVKVTFNKISLPTTFEKYLALHQPQSETLKHIYSTEIAMAKRNAERLLVGYYYTSNPQDDVSIVNSVVTPQGGSHLDEAKQCLSEALKAVEAKYCEEHPGGHVQLRTISSRLSVVCVASLVNPKFDSQSKGRLVSPVNSQGASHTQVVDGLAKWITGWSNFADFCRSEIDALDSALSRAKRIAGGKSFHLPRVVDAPMAGRGRGPCTLVITEGDSAKALAVSSIPQSLRQWYGVFPLKGKLLNIRRNLQKLGANKELQELCLVLGAKPGTTITDPSQLRYQRILIMTDQDVDGSHIRGLVINFIDVLWPKLLNKDGFVDLFVTPLLKVFAPGQKPLCFYSSQEFESWRQKQGKAHINVKYYKGLGTSTREEGKEYFADMNRHTLRLVSVDDSSRKQLANIFDILNTDWRKKWVMQASIHDQPLPKLHVKASGIAEYTLKQFLDTELVYYAVASDSRALPSLVDGLKPSQRKAFFGVLRRGQKGEIKIPALAGYIQMTTGYHHGESSLHGVLIKLAQTFVGSNNIPLLQPIGQFGSRLAQGSDHAAPRYIFTKLHELGRIVFHPNDDPCLKYVEEDGSFVEPFFFVPIIPMLFVNGCAGIGTGFATKITSYNPIEIIGCIRSFLSAPSPKEAEKAIAGIENLLPYSTGWGGSVSRDQMGYLLRGKYQLYMEGKNNSIVTVRVTELPFDMSTELFRERLSRLVEDKHAIRIDDYSTSITVDIDIVMKTSIVAQWIKAGTFEVHMSLARPFKCNHTCFSSSGRIHDYGLKMGEMFKEYCDVRLHTYGLRKKHTVSMLENDLCRKRGVILFNDALQKEKLNLVKLTGSELHAYFVKNHFPRDPATDSYRYLTDRSISSINRDDASQMISAAKQLEDSIAALKKKTVNQLWQDDLNVAEPKIKKYMESQRATIEGELRARDKCYGRPISESVFLVNESERRMRVQAAAEVPSGEVSKLAKGARATAPGKSRFPLVKSIIKGALRGLRGKPL